MRYFLSICLLFGTGLGLAQTASQTPPTAISNTEISVPSPTPIPPQNLIHLGDLIDVDVIGSTDFDWRGTLTPDGYLDGVDFVDEPIFALCRSESAVAAEVVKGYQKLLRNPQVEVKILDRSGRPISYLYGAVKTPQRFKIQREIRLNELIIISGGLTEKSNGEIQIIRSSHLNCEAQNSNQENSTVKVKQEIGSKTLNIKLSDLLQGKQDSNPLILNGDIITVFEAEPIYVIGGVSNPRQINSRSQLTVSRAIASAGGLTKGADRKSITIFRKEKGELKTIEVDLEKIEANQAEDVVLQKFDIVEVRQIGSAKRKFAPVVKSADSVENKILELPLRVIE
jgi:protein involved in polysaccharide export with SLBB domain